MDTAHSPNATSEFGLAAPKRGNSLVPFLVFAIVLGFLAGTGVYIFLSGLSFTDIFHLSEEQGADTSQDVVPPKEDQSDEQADTSEIQNDAASACEDVEIDCAGLLTDETVEGNWTYVGTTVFEYSPEFAFLPSVGLLKSNGSSGLSVAIAGYDYEFPLHFSDGLTRIGNGVSLGGNVYDDVTIRMGIGTEFLVTGSGEFRVLADATFGWIYAEDALVDDLAADSLSAESLVAHNAYISGNVGIGTTSPGAKLEVAGQVKITGGSPGANKVLTSDSVGLASWTDLGGLGVTSVSNSDGTLTISPITGDVVASLALGHVNSWTGA